MNTHAHDREEYLMRRVSTIIAGLFVVSLAASPMLWAAGTGGTSSNT